MLTIQRIIDMVDDIESRDLIEKSDRLIDKMDRWAIIEGMADLFTDISTIKGQLIKTNNNIETVIRLKKEQLKKEKRRKK